MVDKKITADSLTVFLICGLFLSAIILFPQVQDSGVLKSPFLCIFSLALIFQFKVEWPKILVIGTLFYLLEIGVGTTHYVNSSESQLFVLLGLLSFLVGFAARSVDPWLTPVLTVTTLIQLRGGWDFLFGQPWGGGISGTVTSFFVHKNIFGFLLNPILFFHFWLWPNHKTFTKIQKGLYYINISLLPVLIAITGSRGAQFGAFVGFLSFLLMRPKISVPARLRGAGYIAILCFGIAGIYFIPEWQLRAISETFMTASGEKPFRIWAWEAALKLIGTAPWFGHGNGSFRYMVIPFQEASWHFAIDPFIMLRNAHSHYLEVLADRGVAGIALEFSALIPSLFFLFRAGQRGIFSAQCAFAALLGVTMHSIFAEASEYPTSILTYWGLIGFGWRYAPLSLLKPLPGKYLQSWNLLFFGGIAVYGIIIVSVFMRYEYFDFLYVRAMKIKESNPPEFSRYMNRILSGEPNHLEASYLFSVNLAEKGKFDLGKKQIRYVNSIAPNQKVPDLFLATLFFKQAEFDSAFQYASQVQSHYPFCLATFEIMARSAAQLGQCNRVDSLKHYAKRWMFGQYPDNRADTFTSKVLDRRYRQEPSLNGLQRFFGGEKLKEKFTLHYEIEYYNGIRDYENLSNLMRLSCPLKNPDS